MKRSAGGLLRACLFIFAATFILGGLATKLAQDASQYDAGNDPVITVTGVLSEHHARPGHHQEEIASLREGTGP